MTPLRSSIAALAVIILALPLSAAPQLDLEKLGKSLGGWTGKGKKAAKYEVSGSRYRSWKPEVTPTLEGGIFVSIRIDHLRGLLASDDHASLEVTFDKDGNIVSARSTIALQGKRVTSDLIESSSKFGASVVGMERAAKIGTEMVSSISAKILRENIKEPGRVSFPAVLQHQYNLLALSLKSSEGEGSVTGEDKGKTQNQKKPAPLVIDSPKGK